MIDIMEQSFQKVVESVELLNLKSHFQNLVQRYVKIHNRGGNVSFNFIATTAEEQFRFYRRRYRLDEQIFDGFSNRETRYSKIRTNPHKQAEEDEIARRIKETKSLLDDFESGNVETELKKPVQTILMTNLKNYKHKQEVIHIEKKLFLHFQEERHLIWKTLLESEKQLLLFLFQSYISNVKTQVKKLLGTENIQVRFSRKSILDEFSRFYRSGTDLNRVYKNSSWTPFEEFLINFLWHARLDFEIYIQNKDKIFNISKGNVLHHSPKQKQLSKNLNEALLSLDNYLKKYPAFLWLLKSRKLLTPDLYEEFLDLIADYYPMPILQRYDVLSKNVYNLINQEKQNSKWNGELSPSVNEELQNSFPDVHFSFEEKITKVPFSGEMHVFQNTVLSHIKNDFYCLSFKK